MSCILKVEQEIISIDIGFTLGVGIINNNTTGTNTHEACTFGNKKASLMMRITYTLKVRIWSSRRWWWRRHGERQPTERRLFAFAFVSSSPPFPPTAPPKFFSLLPDLSHFRKQHAHKHIRMNDFEWLVPIPLALSCIALVDGLRVAWCEEYIGEHHP